MTPFILQKLTKITVWISNYIHSLQVNNLHIPTLKYLPIL